MDDTRKSYTNGVVVPRHIATRGLLACPCSGETRGVANSAVYRVVIVVLTVEKKRWQRGIGNRLIRVVVDGRRGLGVALAVRGIPERAAWLDSFTARPDGDVVWDVL